MHFLSRCIFWYFKFYPDTFPVQIIINDENQGARIAFLKIFLTGLPISDEAKKHIKIFGF